NYDSRGHVVSPVPAPRCHRVEVTKSVPNPKPRSASVRRALAVLLCAFAALRATAQVPQSEYAARRDSLAAAMSDGVLIALGGHEPAEDYLDFFPVPSFYYLTGITEP